MVPSWTPEPPLEEPVIVPLEDQEAPADPTSAAAVSAPVPTPIQIAPSGRFRGTRLALGDFARTGDRGDLRRSMGHYVRTGYGGSGTTTQRFGGAATTAGALGRTLAGAASGQAPTAEHPLDPRLLQGRTASEVMDAIVEAVRPVDGTQDAEAERAAIRDALSELLTMFPDADLLNLDPDQRAFAIERFTAIDVFRRFDLDVGRSILENAPNAATGLARLKEAKDYVQQTVAASFRKLRDAGRNLNGGRISQVVRSALRETFEVFEGYTE
jgi:hypothetical protein